MNRWLYAGGRPNWLARQINHGWASLFAHGAGPAQASTLEVVGRQSGEPIRLPIVVADYQGGRYLVSMLGPDANWVANVKAAGGEALLHHGQTRHVRLVELPPGERAPILKRYLELAPGARPHFPVAKDAPITEFEKIAIRYPVVRVRPTAGARRSAPLRTRPRRVRGVPPPMPPRVVP